MEFHGCGEFGVDGAGEVDAVGAGALRDTGLVAVGVVARCAGDSTCGVS